MHPLRHAPAVLARLGGGLPTPNHEAALLACLRDRVEAGLSAGSLLIDGQAPGPRARVRWEREERCTEREDLRAKLGLSRSVVDRLPSGRTLRGRVSPGRWFRRTWFGISAVVAPSWREFARSGDGAVSTAEAIDYYERQRAVWRRQRGSAPFFAAVAARFAEPDPHVSSPALALISWEGDRWRFCEPAGVAPELLSLFYPRTPAECAVMIEEHLDEGAGLPRLAAEVALEVDLPLAVVLSAGGKNFRRHALEYRSGQPLFFRS